MREAVYRAMEKAEKVGAAPTPAPPTTNVSISANSTCASAGIPAGNCSGSNGG